MATVVHVGGGGHIRVVRGSSSPSGLRVCTNSYVFDLSLSLVFSLVFLYGTILMYPELCYCSWIL